MIDIAARGAWNDLDAKLRPFVARRVRSSSDVDDVVQNVFLRMQRGLSDLRDDERFGPWVYQVARSAIADHHRSVRRHPIADGAADEPRAELEVEDDRTAEQDLAAEMIGISLSGMKSRVQRGREHLRKSLEDCCTIALDARGRVVSCEPRVDGKLPDCRCR